MKIGEKYLIGETVIEITDITSTPWSHGENVRIKYFSGPLLLGFEDSYSWGRLMGIIKFLPEQLRL